MHGIDGLVQDCSNSIANAMELLQSCTKPAVLSFFTILHWAHVADYLVIHNAAKELG